MRSQVEGLTEKFLIAIGSTSRKEAQSKLVLSSFSTSRKERAVDRFCG